MYDLNWHKKEIEVTSGGHSKEFIAPFNIHQIAFTKDSKYISRGSYIMIPAGTKVRAFVNSVDDAHSDSLGEREFTLDYETHAVISNGYNDGEEVVKIPVDEYSETEDYIENDDLFYAYDWSELSNDEITISNLQSYLRNEMTFEQVINYAEYSNSPSYDVLLFYYDIEEDKQLTRNFIERYFAEIFNK